MSASPVKLRDAPDRDMTQAPQNGGRTPLLPNSSQTKVIDDRWAFRDATPIPKCIQSFKTAYDFIACFTGPGDVQVNLSMGRPGSISSVKMEIPDSTENSDNEILGDLGFICKEAGAEAYCGGYIGDDLVLEFKSYEEVLEQQERLFRCPPWDEISDSDEGFNEDLESKVPA
ncbi:hypothetical protein NOF04DRAFT_1350458 [Fusarium oxysporum II5]|nr:hypothetical protein NOF04DRAFT_1350458 [Fusarium oxysporum II5]